MLIFAIHIVALKEVRMINRCAWILSLFLVGCRGLAQAQSFGEFDPSDTDHYATAMVIYENAFPTETKSHTLGKPLTLKFIVILEDGQRPMVAVFEKKDSKKVPTPNQSGDDWYWSLDKNAMAKAEQNYIERYYAWKQGLIKGPEPTPSDLAPNLSTETSTIAQTNDVALANSESLASVDAINKALQTYFSVYNARHRSSRPSAQHTLAGYKVEVTGSPIESSPFNTIPTSAFFPQPKSKFMPPKSTFRMTYENAARWIAGYYAANNPTKGARNAGEVFGVALLHAHTEGKVVYFTVAYGALQNTTKGFYSDSFDPIKTAKAIDTQIDVPQLLSYVYGLDSTIPGDLVVDLPADGGRVIPEIVPPPSRAQSGPPCARSSSTNMMTVIKKPPVAEDKSKPFGRLEMDVPTFNYDSSGASAADTLTLPSNVTGVPSFKLAGTKYFTHDYYTGTFDSDWKLGDSDSDGTKPKKPVAPPVGKRGDEDDLPGFNTIGLESSRSVQPNGTTATKYSTSEVATLKGQFGLPDKIDLTYNQSAGAYDKSNHPTTGAPTKTDEYAALSYLQELRRFYWSSDDQDPTPSRYRGTSAEMDATEWIKPSDVTPTGNLYAGLAARYHLGTDIPAPWELTGPAEFIRIDNSITVGRILGAAPDTDNFYGGNNPATGTPNDLPTPVIRSFGTGKLGLYPASGSGKMAGATTYASTNFTMALPIPYVAFPFLDEDEASALDYVYNISSGEKDGSIAHDQQTMDTISYLANYNDVFCFRPLFTCDAAWLSGPSTFSNRTLVAVGGGAEMSFSVINFDILYEVTLQDTAEDKQPLGRNIIAQITYDIHF